MGNCGASPGGGGPGGGGRDEGASLVIDTIAGLLSEAAQTELRVEAARCQLLHDHKVSMNWIFDTLDRGRKGYLTNDDIAVFLAFTRPTVRYWDVLMMLRRQFGTSQNHMTFERFAHWLFCKKNHSDIQVPAVLLSTSPKGTAATGMPGTGPFSVAAGSLYPPMVGTQYGGPLTGVNGEATDRPELSLIVQALLADLLVEEINGHKRLQRFARCLRDFENHRFTPEELHAFLHGSLEKKEKKGKQGGGGTTQEEKGSALGGLLEDDLGESETGMRFFITPSVLLRFFEAHGKEGATRTEEWARLAIARFDRDGNGQLSREEFCVALRVDPPESAVFGLEGMDPFKAEEELRASMGSREAVQAAAINTLHGRTHLTGAPQLLTGGGPLPISTAAGLHSHPSPLTDAPACALLPPLASCAPGAVLPYGVGAPPLTAEIYPPVYLNGMRGGVGPYDGRVTSTIVPLQGADCAACVAESGRVPV
uniref:EF-hand domain-containing protein n=1 Tax=Chromera velia CCMP2878 TaxID=1169474 RepID=A0A0G4HRA2_9ALVE|eukprot:Cvel_8065.t1-p1 / transcript=Cvel_8065.t1 / gene=Cvel_8065 / organism=Chromera_velia_CCMP2878 / gene_product=hypothetical protein / transcript_product=hypothetical protein / location=Cvel_scaffold437:6495-11561(-) / protein_length=479 / sequence_SO=supercontig / SO=protein_coding / is_pseudo=false